ncbi:NUDIX domain-containing protein [Tsuneonella sp. YG55]|uniref:NUDIX domain-containing protein n=1 Tax=Tsuneonella litorea TaxID=2976475 RepID=A0A9X3AA36_9SPHN|nr:NUDIX domain-containing protein [Tsuneonella litorea]MCT2559515.1 NUDIX domain-containing protein [Tsuneonella litorea]
MTETSDRPSIPAATVIVFRNDPAGGSPQILMVTRHNAMTFAGGMAVFPGGRVDPEDHALAATLDTEFDSDEAAHRIAAVRETLEETGLAIGLVGDVSADTAREARALLEREGALAPVLAAMDWSLDLGSVVPFARWHPKNERIPRIFDTRFYLADLGTGAVELEIDGSENTHLFWTSASGALDMASRGDLSVIFPTRRNLERLAQFGSFAEARAHAEATPVRTITPWMEERGGVRWLRIPDDAGYPVAGEPLTTAARG